MFLCITCNNKILYKPGVTSLPSIYILYVSMCMYIKLYTLKHSPFRRQILYWIDACIIKMIQMKLEWIKFQKRRLVIGFVWYMQ